MVKDNKYIQEDLNLGGFSNNSFCYPLHLSFKDLSLTDVLPLLEDIFSAYNVEFISIRRRGGSS
jgi:hypothetical protein